jgi:ABC-type glutathione transport system ATPase component
VTALLAVEGLTVRYGAVRYGGVLGARLRFGAVTAFEDVSFDVAHGFSKALAGPSSGGRAERHQPRSRT